MIRRMVITTVLILGLITAALPAAAQVDFSRYYTIGDSLTAGFSHGSLVVTFQQFSFPALLAQQAGVEDFEQPLVSEPGIPPRLVLLSLLPAPVIQPKKGLGHPMNLTLPRPYNNLAVPGADLNDVLNTVSDGGLHDLILRGLGTQLQQFLASSPTFATVWIGNNDVLGAVVSGQVIPGITVTPLQDFTKRLQKVFDGIRLVTNATVVVFTIPNVTAIPFATTIPPVVINPATREPVLDPNGNPIPLIGPTGPLPPGSLVLLTASPLLAQGFGIPVALGGNGQPLPDEVVLLPGEVDQITSTVAAFNNEITSRAQDAGFAVFDVNAILNLITTTGINVGGVFLTNAFLTGGIFSYDGIHPSPLGYAILTNQLITFLNENYGTNLELVNLYPFLTGEKGSNPVDGDLVNVNNFRFSPQAVEQLKQVFARKYLQWKQAQNDKK